MAENTKIEWADHTFNPWMGCTKVSPACDHCYAEVSTPSRTMRVGWGTGQPRIRTSPGNWKLPERWNAKAQRLGVRYRVFCASLADVFDNEVDPQWRVDLFKLIRSTPHLDWLLLTKRIGNAHEMMVDAIEHELDMGVNPPFDAVPWPNVWLGATICNQAEADRDIPKLLAVPAAKRFLSIEPLLGPVQIWRYASPHCERHPGQLEPDGKCEVCEGRGIWGVCDEPLTEAEKAPIRPGVDWVIVGGESGPEARPMHPDWARSLRDQCEAAGVPFLFKQWGEWKEFEPGQTRRVCMDSSEGKQLAEKCDGFISPCGEFVCHLDEATTDGPYRGIVRPGKKAAGRLLDGRTWDGVPS